MPQEIKIRLASQRVNPSVAIHQRSPKIFTPGQVITEKNEFMRYSLRWCSNLRKTRFVF